MKPSRRTGSWPSRVAARTRHGIAWRVRRLRRRLAARATAVQPVRSADAMAVASASRVPAAFLQQMVELSTGRNLAVALLGPPDVAESLAEMLRRRVGTSSILVVGDADHLTRHQVLGVHHPLDLIVDLGRDTAAQQVQRFFRSFMHLAPEGSYVVEQVMTSGTSVGHHPTDHRNVAEFAQAAAATTFQREDGEHQRDLASLGLSIGGVERLGETLVVRNRRQLFPKYRDHEFNAVLQQRPDVGRLVASVSGQIFDSRAAYGDSVEVTRQFGRDFADPHRATTFKVPDLHLRRYDRPTCTDGQVVASHGLLMPDTYRHFRGRRLGNRSVNDSSHWFGDLRPKIDGAAPLQGTYFHFDSEWPGHFGHTLTEQISRLWAFDQVKALDPQVKLLTTLPTSRSDRKPQPWEIDLLTSFGVDAEDFAIFDAPVRPEVLYAATPMFSCPEYVHPDIEQIWRRIAQPLLARASQRDRPDRLFCSRRPALKRSCHNAAEVERFFTDRGFTVIYPEDHDLAEQVALFNAAEVIAGFAGSGLFTMAFCERPKTVIMISPESYTARNEWMFASVLGHRLHVAWSKPDVPHANGWSVEAFSSSFVVNLEQEGRYLADVIDSVT